MLGPHIVLGFVGAQREPLHVYARLLDGRLKRLGGLRLRHARHLGDKSAIVRQAIGVVGIGTRGVVDGQEVTIAVGILGGVLRHPFSMAVVGVAIEARATHAGRAEALKGARVHRVLSLHDLLSLEEEVEETLVVVDSWRLV